MTNSYFDMDEEKVKSPWLSIHFGCCAAKHDVDEDEGRTAWRAHGETEMRICSEQPQLVPQPTAEAQSARPSTSHTVSQHVSQWVASSRDFARRASVATLTRPGHLHSRPSISAPTNFRRYDGGDGFDFIQGDAGLPIFRRRSFRPLELSIYMPDGCGSLDDLPDFEDQSLWNAELPGLQVPKQAVVRVRDSRTSSLSSTTSNFTIQRKPVGSSSRRSSAYSVSTSMQERRLSGTTLATMATPTLPLLFDECGMANYRESQSFRPYQSLGTFSPVKILSHLPSPSRSRSNTLSPRSTSVRRQKNDVEDAIRELNTIIEERRASAYRTQSPASMNRPPPSPSTHVPYIAPSMRMKVRSETLSDIGSAFSAPVQVKTVAARASPTLSVTPPRRSIAIALTSNPITPPVPSTPTTPIHKFGAWIKRSTSSLAGSINSRPTTPRTAESFYQCEPYPSHASPSTTGSRTITHTRADSQDSTTTATVTLYSCNSSTRAPSPTSEKSLSVTDASCPPAIKVNKVKRVPAPLNLAKIKHVEIEMALASARIIRATMNARPPMSPNENLLKGMEMSARNALHTAAPVGMAF